MENWAFVPGRKILLVLLFLAGSINILIESFIAPRFQQIFQDTIPGQTLPGLTQFVFACQVPLIVIAAILLFLGFWAVHRKRELWAAVLVVVIVFQVGTTVIAFFLPMDQMDSIVGMKDSVQ